MQLYHCRVCRLQFYDAGQPAEAADRKTAEAAPEKTERMAIAEPAAAVADDPTVIGETVTIMGRVSSREDILLNGEIDGGLDIPGHRLTIGASGRMRGDVLAAEVVALGTVEGNMDARQKLVIRASASMHGDIRSPSPTIEEGALFKGKIETA
jgi:cytoskeletal protein CcmA (bactofilin family)